MRGTVLVSVEGVGCVGIQIIHHALVVYLLMRLPAFAAFKAGGGYLWGAGPEVAPAGAAQSPDNPICGLAKGKR